MNKIRLDILISKHMEISRQKAVRLIENNQVYIDRILRNKKDILINMDSMIDINIEIKPPKTEKPEISYIEVNNDFLVVNKPYGMVCARTINTPSDAYVLNELVRENYSLSQALRPEEFGLAHRLDKTTEGLIILARTTEYYNDLLNLFEKQEVRKTYLAIVKIEYRMREFQGTVTLPLFYGQDKVLVKNDPISVNSVTEYKIVKDYRFSKGHFAVVEIQPHTGRRHQIRVVLSHIGMPIVGDKLYGGLDFERVCLYSSQLEIKKRSLSYSLYKNHMHDINNLLMWLM